ncbi:MAG: ArsR/SmtB family transcription factor [Halanaerobiales bacterium]
MKLIDLVEIQHSLCYDFLCSIIRLYNNEDFKPKEKANKEIFKLFDEWQDDVSQEMKGRYQTYANMETTYCMLISGYIKQWDVSEVPSFLDRLKEVPSRDLLIRFLYSGVGPGSDIDSDDIDHLLSNNSEIVEFINKNISFSSEEKWQVLQFITDPEKMKSEFLELLTWHYDTFYKDQERTIEKELKVYEKELADRLEKYGEEYLKLMVPFDYNKSNKVDKITLAVSYYYERSCMFNALDDLFLFGYRYHEVIEGGHSVLAGAQVFKALADETRLNIIRLLSDRPRYGHEIAQELDISNSTVSHHVANLIMNGLINSYREDNRVYFELDENKLKDIMIDAINKITT